MLFLEVVTSDEVITGLGKKWDRARKKAMEEGVKMYHAQIFPKHFFPSNRARYRLQPRTKFYLTKIKPRKGVGPGRFVDLQLKGVSRRRMMAFFTIRRSDGGNTLVLRMQAPTYFTRKLPGQIDKAAEVERVNDEDRMKIRDFVQGRIAAAWEAKTAGKTRKL